MISYVDGSNIVLINPTLTAHHRVSPGVYPRVDTRAGIRMCRVYFPHTCTWAWDPDVLLWGSALPLCRLCDLGHLLCGPRGFLFYRMRLIIATFLSDFLGRLNELIYKKFLAENLAPHKYYVRLTLF